MKEPNTHGYASDYASLVLECEKEAREGSLDTTLANLARLSAADFCRIVGLAESWWARSGDGTA